MLPQAIFLLLGLPASAGACPSPRGTMDTRASAQPVIQRETIAVGVNARSDQRLARARAALDGLSVGDAFGERFFAPLSIVMGLVEQRALPRPPWEYTDDTQMALSIVEVLRRFDGIDQDALARSFADHFELARGYGPAMYRLLPAIRRGEPWRETARALFAGQGSSGNGAAMRIAPLGAYFADDPPAAVDHARRSAEVTHAHPEAAAGAIAVAAAAAAAARSQGTRPPAPRDLLDAIASQVPASAVRDGIERARDLPPDAAVETAAATLGNGGRVTGRLPCHSSCGPRRGIWATTKPRSGQRFALAGDVDTGECAMVGGVVASYTGSEGIPPSGASGKQPAWVSRGQRGVRSVLVMKTGAPSRRETIMPLDPQLVGHETAKELHTIAAADVRQFAEAIGDTNPIFRDSAHARALAFPAELATPTFVTRFRVPFHEAGLDVERAQVLHGEQVFQYSRPLHVGDQVEVWHRGFAAPIPACDGMAILTLETLGHLPDGEHVFTGHATVIVRDTPPDAGADAAADRPARTPATPDGTAIGPLEKHVTQDQIDAYADASGTTTPSTSTPPPPAPWAGWHHRARHDQHGLPGPGRHRLAGRASHPRRMARPAARALPGHGPPRRYPDLPRVILGHVENGRQSLQVWAENQRGERVTSGDAEVNVPPA